MSYFHFSSWSRTLVPAGIALLLHVGVYATPGNGKPYWLEANTHNSCPVLYWGIPVTLDLGTYDPTVTLYEATQSITFEAGFSTPDGATLVAQIVPNGFGVPQATNLAGTADANINWYQASSYDETGALIADSKQFYDNNGRTMQTQNKVFYRAGSNTVYTHVMASQPIRDAYGREAASTLPAPIDYADFSYRSNFVQRNSSGINYTHQNFDLYTNGSTNTDKTLNPDPLWDPNSGLPAQGTLAWYYSIANTWEPYTPVTNYPYSRQTYYQDGTGNVKKAAGAGEPLKMGMGRDASTYVTPVANELDFYLQVRNKYFATTDAGALPGSLVNQAMQMVSRDVNGTETVTIQDRSGKTLMTAWPGAGLTVNNTVSVSAAGVSDMNIYYFKLMAAGAVGVTGGSYGLYDMTAEQAVSFSSGSTLAAGYYKLVNTGTTAITLTYSNSYTDISYNFYNQKGQLMGAIAPEGTKKLYGSPGLASYATRSSVPFISLFSYDIRGRLISSQDPDRSTQQLVYRNDGNIRFSQNAVQAATGSYSYTNYDSWGRQVETGQYQPDASGIAFGSAAMNGILENTTSGGGLTTGTKTDVTTTLYDVPDVSHGLAGYVQNSFTLAGIVSLTKKYSSIVNNNPTSANLVSATWYNYDEERKVIWMIQYISGLGSGTADPKSYKTTDYTYDALGHLVKKVFQAGTTAETFVHYFDYDPVNKQLWHVYTNTTDNQATRTLQATYLYYLHGGVKRVELAGNLQGIDYTYTLQGARKAINNSNKTQDPGNDGNNGFPADAFGEVLDYYTGDYVNGRSGTSVINGVNASSIATDTYAGNIKAMTWYSEKPVSTGLTDAPTTYVYQYDPRNQFTESTWGTGINFGNTPASFSTTGINKEKIGDPANNLPAYDDNGNIQNLQRTDVSGVLKDKFAYTYNNNTNQLASIVNTATGTAQTYASYSYDARGLVKAIVSGDGVTPSKYMVNDATGKVMWVYQDVSLGVPIVGFVYDEKGNRIKKQSYNNSGQLTQVTYYVGDVIYTQAVTNAGASYGPVIAQEYQINGASNRLGVYYPQGPIYAYEMRDHLGNVRAVIAKNGTTFQVRMYTDYYPFGMVINSGGTNDYRYGYQGQSAEKDPETGWNAFGLRMYDSRIARWLQYDPKGQFFSPYVGMGNNPVSGVDKDGGETYKEYPTVQAYYAENPDGTLDGSDGNWLTSDRENNTDVWKNANMVNLTKANGSDEYTNLDQRADFYRWFQSATDAKGFTTRWSGAAAVTVDHLKTLIGEGFKGLFSGVTGYTNDEIRKFVVSGNKLILDDIWGSLQNLYNGAVLTGKAASDWDGNQLLKEQQVINDSYWDLTPGSITILENSLKHNYFLAKIFDWNPSFKGSLLDVKARWVYGMTLMGYSVTVNNVPIPAPCPQSPYHQ